MKASIASSLVSFSRFHCWYLVQEMLACWEVVRLTWQLQHQRWLLLRAHSHRPEAGSSMRQKPLQLGSMQRRKAGSCGQNRIVYRW